MAQVKKQGLDYFPIDTNFIQHRVVRRIMKREGDGALSVLIAILSYIYSGEGYYVKADQLFYEDLESMFFQKQLEDVERIVNLAVEYGLFDAELFNAHGILTSRDIQRQFLFSTRRRKKRALIEKYCLLDEDDDVSQTPENVTQTGENVTQTPKNVAQTTKNVTQSTHSIEQNSIEQQRKEKLLPDGSSDNGGTLMRETKRVMSEKELFEPEAVVTAADVECMQAPPDGLSHNLDGLRLNMQLYKIPFHEQQAIILRSNYGQIGHPVWQGFTELRSSRGKIKLPGKFLLSLCEKRKEKT